MDDAPLPAAVEPTEWFVVFHMKSSIRWLGWLAMGRFKHVSAVGYCPGFRVWLLCDAQWGGLRLQLFAHEPFKAMFSEWTRDAEVVRIKRTGQSMGLRGRFGFWCVPAIRHLVGLPSIALRPDALYRQCLRSGGVLVEREQPSNSGRSQSGA